MFVVVTCPALDDYANQDLDTFNNTRLGIALAKDMVAARQALA